jgi:hypothetical protein
LFDPGEITFRPTGLARLRALARSPQPALSERERRSDEDAATIERLRRWGTELGRHFGLRYAALDPERDGVTAHYGICYEDGVIRIRLRHATTGRLLKESSLVDTLCHELAHLRYLDHSERFRGLYRRILDTARELGYYKPGPGAAAEGNGPRQLALFRGTEAERCGACSKKRSSTSPGA